MRFYEKDLNKPPPNSRYMRKNKTTSRLKGDELIMAIKEAQKDPQFIREINKFIKATTNVYRLD